MKNRRDKQNKVCHYSIRKTALGVGSVVVGIFLSGGLSDAVYAESAPPTTMAETPNAEEAATDRPATEVNDSVAGTAENGPTVADQTVELENENISRHFSIENGRLRTVSVENKISNETLEFAEDSKEFVLNFKAENTTGYVPYAKDRASWTINTSSENARTGSEGPASLSVDGDLGTHWHSRYGGGTGTSRQLPVTVDLEFPEVRDVKTFVYVPRQSGTNGNIKEYKIYAKKTAEAEFVEIKHDTLTNVGTEPILIDLEEKALKVKALRLEVKTSQNGQPFAAASEFDVSEKSITELRREAEEKAAANQISLDKLVLAKDGVKRTKTDEGETLSFTFQPRQIKGHDVTLKYVVDLKADGKFVQSHFEIKTSEQGAQDLVIDTIDMQSFKVKNTPQIHDFSKQDNIAEMGGFNGFYAGLGQPVYLDSFYTGSEFPTAWNTVDTANGNHLFSRYYAGKSLKDLGLMKDGSYRTWNTTVGVARSKDYQVLQSDFYDYIAKIGQDTYFRKQYNSWFDHMKNITAENIQSGFNEIERGFVRGGVSPLDSFVVDDGWQNMSSLWGFNNKFPNKLYDSSKQVKRFGSDFGLWLGPQGGYGNAHEMANWLARNNKGSAHAGVVYIGDKRYTDGLTELFENYEKEFDINYWKLDGLLLNPRSDTDPNGNFVGGGFKNMYSMTETHERWIKLYETIREHATEPDKMWINLTSYIPPSPWFLQWVNSIWMQNAGDVDYQDGVKKNDLDFGNDVNEAITYRDDSYEKFVNHRKWQIPFANIYNHDPVYGLTANSGKKDRPNGPQRPQIKFSTDDMRTYLYMLGTRGTGFWEFYYSPSMFNDEMWQVNGEAVKWIEANYDILKHAKYHGGKPRDGEAYGYSSWNEDGGILSIRNPINDEKEYTIKLDRLVGVREGTAKMYRKTVLGDKRHDTAEVMNYGDSVTVRLKPYETIVFQYSKEQDTTPAVIQTARVVENNKVNLEFDERVAIDGATFTIAGHTVTEATLNPDLRTVTLTLGEALKDRETVAVSYADVKDNAGQANKATGKVNVTAYDNNVIEDITEVHKGEALSNAGVEGKGAFSVTVKATLNTLNQVLAEQEGNWKLSVDDSGKVVFDVKGVKVTSAPFATLKADDKGTADAMIQPGKEFVVTAARMMNGSLKLFINGELHNTGYDAKKVNETLTKANVTVGTTEFDGNISRFVLENIGRDYKTAPILADALSPKEREEGTPLVENGSQADSFDPNDGGSHPAGLATDTNPNTYWASNPNNNNVTNPQRLTITLETPTTVSKVLYTPRQVNNAVGNIKRGYLEYSTDGTTWTRVQFVGGNEDNTLTMKEGIVSTEMVFTPVEAKYFRLTALETHHWKAENVNKVVAVAELKPVVTVKPNLEVPVTISYLRNAIEMATNIDIESYTEESISKLDQLLETAMATLSSKDQTEIDQMTIKVKKAVAALEKRPVDPVEPTKPEGEVKPGEPTKPEGEVKPGEPTKPEGEVKPGEPTKPEGEVKPGEPTKPEGEVKPGEPTKPEGEVKPGEPTKPEGEVKPGETPKKEHKVLAENLTQPSLPTYDLQADNDGDGYSNFTELVLGSNPEDNKSVPQPKVPNPQPSGTQTDKSVNVPNGKATDTKEDKLSAKPTTNAVTPSTTVQESTTAALPETGEADAYLVFGAAAMAILAGVGLLPRRKESNE